LLIHPPFMQPDEAATWARRSIDLAFETGATAVSLIPARMGNGAMETLAQTGQFVSPALADLESALDYGINRGLGRVFADLWDLRQTQPKCASCWPLRIDRLHKMT